MATKKYPQVVSFQVTLLNLFQIFVKLGFAITVFWNYCASFQANGPFQ